jgi:hypothetical protein
MPVDQRHFEGTWWVCDDGWLGWLDLARGVGGEFEGSFFSERFRESYTVTARSGEAAAVLELVIHDYNWMAEQRYTGFLFNRGRNVITGSSLWRGTPFGFAAWRRSRPRLATYRSGSVEPFDFGGTWDVRLDGEPATLNLEYDQEAAVLRGECWGRSFGPPYAVEGRVGPLVPHEISLTLTRDESIVEPPIVINGYLFSRPKNVVSGVARDDAVTAGFYMLRCR